MIVLFKSNSILRKRLIFNLWNLLGKIHLVIDTDTLIFLSKVLKVFQVSDLKEHILPLTKTVVFNTTDQI